MDINNAKGLNAFCNGYDMEQEIPKDNNKDIKLHILEVLLDCRHSVENKQLRAQVADLMIDISKNNIVIDTNENAMSNMWLKDEQKEV